MRIFKSRVAIYAIISVFMGGVAWAITPAADYKTVTSKAYVDSLISDSDISSHTVNGATLSNVASYFYGISGTTASAGAKTVTISSIKILAPGQIIVVKPENTSNYNGAHTLQLFKDSNTSLGDPAPIYYNGAAVSDAATGALVWTTNVPSTFVYELGQGKGDPNKWVFMGHGLDNDTKIMAGTADDVVTYSGTAGVTGSRGVLSTLDTTQNGLIGGYNDTFSGNTSTWAADPQTGVETGSWAESEAPKLVSVNAFAKGLAKKQNKIAATSSNLTFDNTNPQSAQAKSAGYSVVTTSGVAGSTGQIGVANEALYTTSNNETTLVNGEWIPNMYALDRMLNSATSGTINGASVGSASAYFYDNAGGGTASSCAKTASIPSIGTLSAGQVIVVKPATTSTCATSHTLALNGAQTGQAILYNGSTIGDATTAAMVWTAGVPSTFVYDGTNWVFMGHGVDENTTYGALNDAAFSNGAATNSTSGVVGTGTNAGVISPAVLKNSILDTTLTANTGRTMFSTSNSAITASDTVIGAFGKAQGQISSLGADIGDINERIINGMPFTNSKIPYQFAGAEDTTGVTAASTKRYVDIPAVDGANITDWTVIVVQPGVTADATSDPRAFDSAGLSISINGEKAKDVYYYGISVTDATAPIVWNQNYPSIFVFDGKHWLFAGHGVDNDTGAALVGNKVNGAPLSNTSSYYYGTGTASATGITVTIPSIASTANALPGTGQIIVVQPTNNLEYTCNTINWKLGLNSFTAANVVYGTQKLSCDQGTYEEIKKLVWNDAIPSMFVFDGTNWVFLGHGFDENPTYNALTSDASGAWSGPAGTGDSSGVISPTTLKNSIHRVNLTANSGTTAWAATNSRMTTSDTMLGALGKAQGQIDNRQTLVPATGTYKTLSGTTWTSTSISDYGAAGVKGTSLPTKTGTSGNLGERMIVDSGTDTTGWATAKLANAIPSMSKISAITASMQSQKVCYEYKPGTGANPTDADCWLWRLP